MVRPRPNIHTKCLVHHSPSYFRINVGPYNYRPRSISCHLRTLGRPITIMRNNRPKFSYRPRPRHRPIIGLDLYVQKAILSW